MIRGLNDSASKGFALLVSAQVALFVIGVSWAFGGNADWMRTPISCFGSVGIVLTLTGAAVPGLRRCVLPKTLHWIWPIFLLNALVLASCLTPGFKTFAIGTELYSMPVSVPWWKPSSALPETTLRALWLFDGIYFSCLNLTLAVTRRRSIRFLLAVVVANAAALSIFGTVQKLVGSSGIYFGAIKSPQVMFFASFVYDNHWGAFCILMMGACIGLVVRYAGSQRERGFFGGPAFSGMVAAFLIGLSIPMSGSRACTFLLGILGAVAIAEGIPRVSGSLRKSGLSRSAFVPGIAVAVFLAASAAWIVAGEVIEARVAKTREQVTAMWAQGGIGSRSTLYHDTWRMALKRMPFGWGMGSFPKVFPLYNTQESKIDRIPVVYHDAHSDWLQSMAEIGLIGTLLIGAAAMLPLWSLRRVKITPVPYYLLTGCILVATYAWVEFPFGNVAVVLAWWFSYFAAVQYARLPADR